MNLELERIATHAARLRLPHLAENLPVLAEEAARNEWSYTELVERLLLEEVSALDRRTIEMLEKVATLPFGRSLEEFDFGFQPSVKERQLRELASCAFIERKENVIFLGPPGVGKTHLAVALASEALRRRQKVKFTTVAALVGSLADAERMGTLSRRLALFTGPSLLVIVSAGVKLTH